MFEKLMGTSPFANVVKGALEEARLRGDRRVGTEHLFLGLLHDPGSAPARAIGVDLETARAALESLDQAALASFGIDVSKVPAGGRVLSRKRRALSLSMLTSGARTAIDHSIEATGTRTRSTAPSHLLLALLALDRPDPAAELMAELGLAPSTVRSRLRQS